jgi:hypothetical protein
MDLSVYDEAYAGAEAPSNDGFQPLPDGTYQVFIEDVELKETKETAKPMIVWKFKVLSGNHKGRVEYKNDVIQDEKMSFIKGSLLTCGLILNKFSELPDKIDSLINVDIEITIKTTKKNGNEYRNIYINKRIDTTGEVTEDQIPF